MTPRARLLWFGSAAALVLAGVACRLAIRTFTGDVIALSAITVGVGEALLLVFVEVGLSEDKERAREEERRRERKRRSLEGRPRPHLPRRPRRPS
jgi:hypothetical protein